jgi:CRISPR-associated protein Cmr2
MGKLIGRLVSMEEHRELSRTLAGFEKDAQACVSQHDGHLVYSGGDDVMALLPTNRAISCALELAERFRRLLGPFTAGPEEGGTLSAGIALVHHLEPLQVSLERARAAEKEAKKTRDALAVALHTRGGAPMTASLKWDRAGEWDRWFVAFQNGLARGLPYELRSLALEWKEVWEQTGASIPRERQIERLEAETKRICKRKEGWNGGAMGVPAWVDSPEELERFARLLTLARFLAAQEAGS